MKGVVRSREVSRGFSPGLIIISEGCAGHAVSPLRALSDPINLAARLRVAYASHDTRQSMCTRFHVLGDHRGEQGHNGFDPNSNLPGTSSISAGENGF